MNIIDLEPKVLWQEFQTLCQYPHPSGHLTALYNHILEEANVAGLECLTDNAGNILLRTSENPLLCLQAHYDMVPQKNEKVRFDFEHDPLQLRIVDGQVKATGTTLGADNGIGVAAMMAIMKQASHFGAKLELLFTANEETGMQGARNLAEDWIRSPRLLNLDTETEGVLMTGCAGAVNITATLKCRMDLEVPEGDHAVLLILSGLQGGHSGMDIHLHRANACKLMNRFLKHLVVSFEARLASFNSGTLRNAIPREAKAVITVPEEIVDEVIEEVQYYNELWKDEFGNDEPNLCFTAKPTDLPKSLLPEEIQDDLLNAIEACHNGIWSMGEGYVDTSSNMAHVITNENGEAEVLIMVRSMDEERKRACASAIQSAFLLAGFGVEFSASYGAWNISNDSEFVKMVQNAYATVSDEPLKTDKVHCGLECGILTDKYPELQIVSIGPTIHHPHSPKESVEIDSVERFWKLLIAMINKFH